MKTKTSIFWGLLLIAAGIILCGNLFGLWDVKVFFDGWWTLFIIIPSVYGFFKKEWMSSTIGVIIGVLLLLAARDVIEWKDVCNAFLPLLLIVIGLSLILSKKKQNKTKIGEEKEYIGIFSSSENVVKDSFSGASLIAVFGGVKLDLKKAKIKENTVIECVSIFGGVHLSLPDKVKVKSSGVPIFGGLENKTTGETGPTVQINYVCIFGGVDIK